MRLKAAGFLLGAFSVLQTSAFQLRQDVRIERVAAPYTFTEGPLWAREGYLLYADPPNDKIYKLSSGERPAVFRDDTHGSMGLTFDVQGRLYMCETKGRRVTRLDKKGNLEVLAEAWQGKKLNAPNDIVVRKDGNIYFTDPAFGYQQDKRELDFYGVYHIGLKGELDLVAKSATRPNGIALAPNGRTLYVTNSDEQKVRAYDVGKDGETSNERILISNIEGVPDGIRVDEKGNLYVAARQIFVYNNAGKQISIIGVSETPSNLAWGDSDFATLYVSARSAVYRIRLDVKGSVQY
jgi:sugar lactone lactonase YvrE